MNEGKKRSKLIEDLSHGHSHDMDAYWRLKPHERTKIRKAREKLCLQKLMQGDRTVLDWPDYVRLMQDNIDRAVGAASEVIERNWNEYVAKVPELQTLASQFDEKDQFPDRSDMEKRLRYIRTKAVRYFAQSLSDLGRLEEVHTGEAFFGRSTRKEN